MAIADPSSELIRLVVDPGDPPGCAAAPEDRRAALLLRRRFGLALPPPFAGTPGEAEPVRVATALDAAAIAAIKWRCFGVNYRNGVLADDFLDRRDIVPPVSFWVGRAMLPPSRRHRLWVWGRPGSVFGYLDGGPVHPDDADPGDPSSAGSAEVYELYVDPCAQGHGGGSRLLAEAEAWFASVGFERAELSTLASNPDAQRFYRSRGWEPTGREVPVDLGTVAFTELRYARRLGVVRS